MVDNDTMETSFASEEDSSENSIDTSDFMVQTHFAAPDAATHVMK